MTLAAVAAVAAGLVPAACSSSKSSAVGADAGGVDAGGVDVDLDAPVVGEAAPPPTGYDGGLGLGLADVADTACAMRSGSLDVVIAANDASAGAPRWRNLHAFGARLVADATDGSGFVVFDANGGSANVVTTPLASGGTTTLANANVGAGSINGAIAAAQPFDATGAAIGMPIQLAGEDPEGVAIGADSQSALVVWARDTTIRARGVNGSGPIGQGAYDLAIGALTAEPSLAVSSVQTDLFAVVFSGSAGASYQTAFGRGSSSRRIGDPSNLFEGSVARSVVELARTPNGFALLTNVADGSKPYAMLVLTDVGGHRTSPGLKLLGTIGGAAVAVNAAANTIGVLATRGGPDGVAVEFRPFGTDGTPLGPWVCLDAPGREADLGGGLVADGAGWVAIFRSNDGATSLARFDRLGAGAP